MPSASQREGREASAPHPILSPDGPAVTRGLPALPRPRSGELKSCCRPRRPLLALRAPLPRAHAALLPGLRPSHESPGV